MPWTPESTDPLTATLSPAAIESGLMKLLHEFVSGYLNGGTHTVDAAATAFPMAKVTCQQASIGQPLEGVSVNITLLNPGNIRKKWTGEGKRRLFIDVTFDIWFRAMVTAPRSDGQNAESLVRWASDSLWGVFIQRSNCLPLSRKGITHCKPKLSVLSASGDYAMRTMTLAGKLDIICEP